MRRTVKQQTYDEERALYHLIDADVIDCVFDGPADGESALKESRDISVHNSRFSLRYPLWHTRQFVLRDCRMDETARAALWYATDGVIENSVLNGVKCLREAADITLQNVTAVSSEFGWKCRDLTVRDSEITSDYLFLECRDSRFERLTMHGKYSFQYVRDLTIEDSVLDTKDAFWHAQNVIVKNSVVNGEYLGWYSDGLTLIGCRIRGTQPLCYCKNLRLIDCTMEDADLGFEYSDVEAEVHGEILSVKNPKSGHITADAIGQIIREDDIYGGTCVIMVRG